MSEAGSLKVARSLNSGINHIDDDVPFGAPAPLARVGVNVWEKIPENFGIIEDDADGYQLLNPERIKMRTVKDHIVPGDATDQLFITVTDEAGSGGAHHAYEIAGFDVTKNRSYAPADAASKVSIYFQNGPVPQFGNNGITVEALQVICIDRMRCFQAGPFACADNQEALDHMNAALECLQRRTKSRIARGVEGKEVK